MTPEQFWYLVSKQNEWAAMYKQQQKKEHEKYVIKHREYQQNKRLEIKRALSNF